MGGEPRKTSPKLSVVLPAKNESKDIGAVIKKLVDLYPEAEILLIDDGSVDQTAEVAASMGATVIKHPYSKGNGAAIKTGARAAKGEVIVFMDGDGQHDPADIGSMLNKLEEGYDLVVGARTRDNHASAHRGFANRFYNRLASFMTGYRVEDLTSGFRAARAKHFKRFLYLLPNGFSYPTTSTMAFFRSGLSVAYVPIRVHSRVGKSHIKVFRDGIRFFVIILKVGALFSPMRLFLPISFGLFATGLLYYAYTYFTQGRLTNMSALLFTTSILTFLIGIVSEQISSLHYKGVEKND